MEKTYNRSFVQTLVNWAKSFVLSQDEDEITTIDDKNVAAILAQGQNDTEKLENSLKIVKKGKDKSKEFAQFEQVANVKEINRTTQNIQNIQNIDKDERIK